MGNERVKRKRREKGDEGRGEEGRKGDGWKGTPQGLVYTQVRNPEEYSGLGAHSFRALFDKHFIPALYALMSVYK